MSLSNIGKGTLRVVKNYTKGYTDTQAKVREATSNDPWGPSGSQMNELAQLSYNQSDFVEIMEMLEKRINDKGKNWRHVFKALTVLDYLLHAGSENVVIYAKDNIYVIKTLKEFQYVDEYDKDHGANVRQKAKDVTNLLTDDAKLREARKNRASMRDRMLRGEGGEFDPEDENSSRRQVPPGGAFQPRRNREDDELRKAIEASKASYDKEQGKGLTSEERDLMAALKASEEEEEKRKKALVDANQRSLFDDSAPQQNNPFPLVNFDQQPQFQLQPQYMQPQFTAFNPYQQQAEQEALQAEYLRQQQEAFARQQAELQAQQLQAQMQQAQQDEYLRQQQLLQYEQQQQLLYQQQQQQLYQQQQQQQQLMQQQQAAFANSNPFALSQSPQPQPQQQPPPQPTPVSPVSTPNPVVQPRRDDGQHAHLASLFANRVDDGIDSFGNIGNLRYGTQAGRLLTQPTGSNPFARQQQNSEQPFFTI